MCKYLYMLFICEQRNILSVSLCLYVAVTLNIQSWSHSRLTLCNVFGVNVEDATGVCSEWCHNKHIYA